uniref:(S)-N-methylcoclaurine 3'-hydroxylase isozyme 2 n=1 Tax=Vitis vinifera TaxID=29760 RepID=F6HUH3_VITVI
MAQTALTEGVSVLPSILPLPPLIFLILKHLKAKSPSLPPGPYPWPLIGNVHQIGKQRHIAMIDFARSYVPLFSLRLGTQTLVVGSSAAAAREILNSYDHILCARCVPRVIPCRITGLNGFAVGWSPECDDRWKYLRTMCRTQLFSGKAIESQACLREKKLMEVVMFLSSMEGKELLVAGTDSSSVTVEWAMAELIRSPESLKKIREELTTEINQNMLKDSDLRKLPYLQACLKETLRLHPPGPFLLPHRAVESCKVMNYTIPKDAQVLVNAWAIGRDPMSWEDPLVFKPERFLNSTVDFQGNNFEFIPFSSRRRICPGLPMAVKLIPLVLASWIHFFDWSLPNGGDPKDIDMSEKYSANIRKEQPLLLIPKGRK